MKTFSNSAMRLQQGLTLVELMVALLLGLMLTAGALQVFISSKDSFRVTESNSQLMQNGRIGLDFLNRGISMAGFYSNFQSLDTEQDPIFPAAGTFERDQVIEGTNNSITVRYYGYDDDLITDCQGGPIATTSITSVTYYLAAGDVANTFNLMCSVAGKSPDVVLAENIEQLEFRYGLATTSENNVARYVTAADVGSNWDEVRAVRIGILFRSGIRANSTTNTRSYDLFGTSYSSNDNFLRETFVSTAGLWNVMQ